MKRLEIHVGDPASEGLNRFAAAWRSAAAGKRVAEASNRLSFAEMPQLLATLTAKRLELLECLAGTPGLSIRALAKRLARDYKRVHGDVIALIHAGIIERDGGGYLRAPYDELVIHAPLRAAA